MYSLYDVNMYPFKYIYTVKKTNIKYPIKLDFTKILNRPSYFRCLTVL